jgi:myo-inositol-1(or 4)-monophosphatase
VTGPSDELDAMTAAARVAGEGLMRRFRDRGSLRVELKGRADFVSTADLESQETLRARLLGAYPTFGFLAEEGDPAPDDRARDARFIVDPLDGTTNFLHGLPHFAVAIALERRGRVVAGVVYDPAKNEMFAAREGAGTTLDGSPARVATDRDLSAALVGTGIPHSNAPERHELYLRRLAGAMKEAAGIRRFGAAALDLAYVAAGRFAAFFETGLKPWDVAAGAHLVREGGGRVSELGGGHGDVVASGEVLATNGHVHDTLIALLRDRPRAG